MGWLAASGSGVDAEQAARAGTQAGTFLAEAIHAEVDGAQIDPIQVLMDPGSPAQAVYAVTAVAGPLRNYLATAWGGSEHVASKEIVAHGTIEECRQAVQDVVGQRTSGHGSPRTYVLIGTWSGEDAGQ
jgi:hypothetical protein